MTHSSKTVRQLRQDAAGYLFLLPSFILLLTFTILPIGISVLLSFAKFNGFSALKLVGLHNYRQLFESPDFLASMKNTVWFVLMVVPAQTLLSLILAALLASHFRDAFGEFVRGTMFIPVLCSSVLAGTVFYYLFASDSEAVINSLLAAFGLEKQNWLGQRSTALFVICLVDVWKNVGYFLVIFYAGILDIPKSYYEAAAIDGANRVQEFFHITLPNLRAVLYMVVTLGTIWAFQVFDLTYVMTKGGPGNATTSPVLLLYNEAFSNLRFGYASAIACVLAIVIFAVSMIQRAAFHEKAGT